MRLESEENIYEEIQGHKQMIRNASNSHIGVKHPDLYAYVNMTVPNIASENLDKLPAPRPRRMVKHLVDHFEHGSVCYSCWMTQMVDCVYTCVVQCNILYAIEMCSLIISSLFFRN